jgi:hypothetical protein
MVRTIHKRRINTTQPLAYVKTSPPPKGPLASSLDNETMKIIEAEVEIWTKAAKNPRVDHS